MGFRDVLPSIPLTRVNLKDFAGSTAVVDGNIWLCKAIYGKMDVGKYFSMMIDILLLCQITVLVVFDGLCPSAKDKCRELRRKNRKMLHEKRPGAELAGTSEGQFSHGNDALDQAIKVLERKGIWFMICPFEADPEIAKLFRSGRANLVITEDTDSIGYGITRIIFKLKGLEGYLFEESNFEEAWKKPLNFPLFQAVASAIQCDYLPGGIPGFGIESAKEAYHDLYHEDFSDYNEFLDYLITCKGFNIPTEILEAFRKAMETFKYQIIFDVKKEVFCPLEDYPEGKSSIEYPQAGLYEDATACIHTPMHEPVIEMTIEKFNRLDNNNCGICSKTFDCRNDMFAHRRAAHCRENDETCVWQCPECPKKYGHDLSLLNHMATHAEDLTQLVCKICVNTFANRSSLAAHMSRHKSFDLKPIKCNFCTMSFVTTAHLARHVKVHGVSIFVCDICSESFGSKYELETHAWKHTGVKKFSCDICPKSFTKNASLVAHLCSHTGEYNFMCDVCGRKFGGSEQLRKHKLNHSRKYLCEDCGKAFHNPTQLKVHHESLHQKIRYDCPVCKESFSTNSSLITHKKNVHKNENAKLDPDQCYPCSECELTFVSARAYKQHFGDVHLKYRIVYDTKSNTQKFDTKEASVKDSTESITRQVIGKKIDPDQLHHCQECGKTFTSPSGYRHHFRSVHLKIGFKCQICLQTFTRKNALVRHTTTGKCKTRLSIKNRFLCNTCGKKFIKPEYLQRHIQKFHGGREKKFKCDFLGCDKKYRYAYELKNHQKAHVNMTFTCVSDCALVFGKEMDLKEHQETCGVYQSSES